MRRAALNDISLEKVEDIVLHTKGRQGHVVHLPYNSSKLSMQGFVTASARCINVEMRADGVVRIRALFMYHSKRPNVAAAIKILSLGFHFRELLIFSSFGNMVATAARARIQPARSVHARALPQRRGDFHGPVQAQYTTTTRIVKIGDQRLPPGCDVGTVQDVFHCRPYRLRVLGKHLAQHAATKLNIALETVQTCLDSPSRLQLVSKQNIHELPVVEHVPDTTNGECSSADLLAYETLSESEQHEPELFVDI